MCSQITMGLEWPTVLESCVFNVIHCRERLDQHSVNQRCGGHSHNRRKWLEVCHFIWLYSPHQHDWTPHQHAWYFVSLDVDRDVPYCANSRWIHTLTLGPLALELVYFRICWCLLAPLISVIPNTTNLAGLKLLRGVVHGVFEKHKWVTQSIREHDSYPITMIFFSQGFDGITDRRLLSMRSYT